MRHAMLAMVLVLAGGCVSYDTPPCDTLGCVKRVAYKECMHAFARIKMKRGFVIILPYDDPVYQMEVCQNKAAKIRVY